jgi:hypothetical protein
MIWPLRGRPLQTLRGPSLDQNSAITYQNTLVNRMKTRKQNGEGENARSGAIEPFRLPENARLGLLAPEEVRVVVAIVEKTPGESWETVARSLRISRRQLYNVRQSARVQAVLGSIARQLLQSDLVDVLKVLTQKAKAGDNAAMRLFLELTEKYNEAEKVARSKEDPHARLRELLGDGPPDDSRTSDSWNQ